MSLVLKTRELLVLPIIYDLSLCNSITLQHKATIILLLFILMLLIDLLDNVVFDIVI